MLQKVMEMLDQIGYTCTPKDEKLITFLTEKVESDILSYTNQSELPTQLEPDLILAVCGELLQFRKAEGTLDMGNLNFDGIKSLTEGDTSITFVESETDEAKFSKFVTYLTSWKRKALRFRRLVW